MAQIYLLGPWREALARIVRAEAKTTFWGFEHTER
jgi:hypothetical protein